MALMRNAWRRIWVSAYFALAVSGVTFCAVTWLIVSGFRDGDTVRWVTGLVAMVPVTFRVIGSVLVIVHRNDDTSLDA